MPTSSHGTPNDRMAKAWGEALFLPQAVIPQIVPGRGLEPLRISPPDPKSGASANSATPANCDAHEPRCVARCGQITLVKLLQLLRQIGGWQHKRRPDPFFSRSLSAPRDRAV